ncbi:reductive dehalogenase [Desulfitobacterium dichloroeliminans LMG P-21439]|uniref:Reductive dehalogenase n=2 Tax=Desulfitobacterium dichloroeliminans TaxID=233055 RepID=L0F4Z7_DESDL|nr:reductive dehalogenase [Desulfitobacterium dichloroeliminans]AGA68909.1 reductive dehalogenase [Desulfitobacterium dichloroeliminans LMG P-21439]CAJ75430.1 dichloroethane reductive dehalogenase [Desulfitobacterium dichloroeliminans LMG P-21439]
MGEINRRNFLKASMLGAAAAAVASASVVKGMVSPLVADAADIVAPITETSEFPYKVDAKYQRYNCMKNFFEKTFDPEANKTPIKFHNDDVSKITGKKDTGKDLPTLNAERLGIKGRPATHSETGVLFFGQHTGVMPHQRSKETGNTLLDDALQAGVWAVEFDFHGFNATDNGPGTVITPYPINPMTNEIANEPVMVPGLYNWDNIDVESVRQQGKQWKFKSKEEASKMVKKAACFLGADLVGIAPYDERWTYSTWGRKIPKPCKMPNGRTKLMPWDLPKVLSGGGVEVFGHEKFEPDWEKYAGFKPKSVIVFVLEEDYEALRTSPSVIANAATGKVYSSMGGVSYKIAVFLRKLGYYAAPSGNNTGLNVPMAVQAGLGEAGRNGLLITQKFGPRHRISKVYTDLELAPDKPRKFGVREFCRLCKKCADACPAQAISHEKDPKVLQPGDCEESENPYTEKWHVDSNRCGSFWAYNGGLCANCVAVCSFNKIETWNHDVARIATRIPLLQDAARKFDEWFGYSGPVNPDERLESGYVQNMVKDFWNNPESIKQ